MLFFFFLMIRRPPRSTLSSSSAASDVYKRQVTGCPWTTTIVRERRANVWLRERPDARRGLRLAEGMSDAPLGVGSRSWRCGHPGSAGVKVQVVGLDAVSGSHALTISGSEFSCLRGVP